MAGFTLTDLRNFPNGTTVKAVPKSNWPTPGLPSGAPKGSATNEQTMTSGTLTFTGLTEGTEYWAVAEVGGVYRYVGFVAGADVANTGSLLLGAADALTYKGAKDCSANPKYPASNAGDTYRVSVAGKIGGASGTNVEVGDLLICNTDSSVEGTQAEVGSKWNVIQSNIDGAVVGPSSATDANLALFNGTTGKIIKDGGTLATAVLALNGAWIEPSLLNSWANFESGWAKAAYMKDALGFVHLRGRIKSGTATIGTAIFTLPSGFRPPAKISIPCVDSTSAAKRIDIDSEGKIAPGVELTNTFLNLDGCCFSVNT